MVLTLKPVDGFDTRKDQQGSIMIGQERRTNYNALVFKRAATFFFMILLVTGVVSGAELTAEPTQLLPGTGAPAEIMTNIYPTVKNNATIMEYIGECGVGSWYSEQVNADFRSVHLSPADSCGKQLVFMERKHVERGDPAQIADVWIFDVNETWTVPPEYSTYPGSSAGAEEKPAGTQKSPGFGSLFTVTAISVSAVAFRLLRRGRRCT